MIICPNCNNENLDQALLCQNCGAPLPSSPVPTGDISADALRGATSFESGSTAQPSASPGSPVAPPPPPTYVYNLRPAKDRSLAVILEVLPGLFGFLGFGWIYAGNTTAGILILFGYLVWIGIAALITIATMGFGCLCTFPVNVAAIAISAIMLDKYAKQHPELFGTK